MRVMSARMVSIDPVTDLREYVAPPEDEEELVYLREAGGSLCAGLRGWPPYTHTLTLDGGHTYHVEVSAPIQDHRPGPRR